MRESWAEEWLEKAEQDYETPSTASSLREEIRRLLAIP